MNILQNKLVRNISCRFELKTKMWILHETIKTTKRVSYLRERERKRERERERERERDPNIRFCNIALEREDQLLSQVNIPKPNLKKYIIWEVSVKFICQQM